MNLKILEPNKKTNIIIIWVLLVIFIVILILSSNTNANSEEEIRKEYIESVYLEEQYRWVKQRIMREAIEYFSGYQASIRAVDKQILEARTKKNSFMIKYPELNFY